VDGEQGRMDEEGGSALRAYRELDGEIAEVRNLTHPMLFVRPDGGMLALLPRGLTVARANKELAALLFGVLLDCCAFDSVVTSIGEAICLAQRVGTVV
jgi:hypothetical protein